MRSTRRQPVPPHKEPSGLAMTGKHRRSGSPGARVCEGGKNRKCEKGGGWRFRGATCERGLLVGVEHAPEHLATAFAARSANLVKARAARIPRKPSFGVASRSFSRACSI